MRAALHDPARPPLPFEKDLFKYTISLADGSRVTFDGDAVAGQGGEKIGFFTPDRQRVVLFFNSGLTDRAARVERLKKILGGYNLTTGKNAGFWKDHFCWPEGFIDGCPNLPREFLARNGIFDPPLGVMVPAYAANFFFRDPRTGDSRKKDGRWFTGAKSRKLLPEEEKGNFRGYLSSCIVMARAVRKMHSAGLAHSDLSNKNVLIDPRNGKACLTDVDSLVVPGFAPPTVIGTPGYIAPEVVAGRGQPCIETDLHALAVLLYETLLIRHPLIGPKVHSMDPEECERLATGERALFIEHPTDRSNWPTPPPPIPYQRLGPHLERLFYRAFAASLHQPKNRPTAYEWEIALYKTWDNLHPAPDGKEWLVLAPGLAPICPYTGRALREPVPFAEFYRPSPHDPGEFVPEAEPGQNLTIYHGLKIMRWHRQAILPTDDADRTPQGTFTVKNGRWLLVNESDDPMFLNGDQPVSRNGKVEIKPGTNLLMSAETNGRLLIFDFIQPSLGAA
jgi:serine/threonine protein kinase